MDKEFADSAKAKKANPARNPARPCVYVGYTSKTPRVRFKQHMSGEVGKAGYKLCSKVVFKYGVRLLPDLFQAYNPIRSKADAMEVEILLARILRLSGYTVCQK